MEGSGIQRDGFGLEYTQKKKNPVSFSYIYRSHSGDQETKRLFEYLGEAPDMALHQYPSAQLIFLGGFNACHEDWLFPYQKTNYSEAWNFRLSLDLFQLVTQETRVSDVVGHAANCLDLLLTTDPDNYRVEVTSPLGTSDHYLVKSVFTNSPPAFEPAFMAARLQVGISRCWTRDGQVIMIGPDGKRYSITSKAELNSISTVNNNEVACAPAGSTAATSKPLASISQVTRSKRVVKK